SSDHQHKYVPCKACNRSLSYDGQHQRTRKRPLSSRAVRHDPCYRDVQNTGYDYTLFQESKHPPSNSDLERLSRPKTAPSTTNCNWNNFIKKKTISTPYATCDLSPENEWNETRPPFANYGSGYNDKQTGKKRTFNSLAVHQLKHNELDEIRRMNHLHEIRLRQQAEAYFRELDERRAMEAARNDRNSRNATEYREKYRPPNEYISTRNVSTQVRK
ncbi:unnamed protein product, partial [Didymodactylos carnosus]